MTTASRNLAVGLFVLLALMLLGWMVIQFGTQPRLLRPTYTLTMQFPTIGAVTRGSEVKVGGLAIGHVRSIEPINDFLDGVRVVADIERGHNIPTNSRAIISAGGVSMAKPFISIEVARDAKPEFLPKDGTASLPGEIRTDGLIPPEMQQSFERLADSLNLVARDLHALLGPRALAGPAAPADQPNLSSAVQRLDALLARMNELLDRKDGDIGVALARLRDATANAVQISQLLEKFLHEAVAAAGSAERTFNTATTQVDRIGQTATAQLNRVGDSLTANSVQLSEALNKLNKMMADIERGRGTFGRLLTDPALFENMVLATDRMHQAIIEFERLLQQWQREGVPLKLK